MLLFSKVGDCEMAIRDDKLGPYELRGELGRGAMARVWRGWDPNLEREVAIKELLFDSTLSEAVRNEIGRRFVREGVTAAGLNHPNIVAIYAADVWDGRPAIVMELVEGATLADLLSAGPLSPNEAIDVLDQLLDAVGYAHERGVVHRDIKPDNAFVSREGRVKLADFGIAHVDSAATRATVAGSVLGTPGYMSPEQARGAAVDARSDLFSMGVLAYEMLSGANPFVVGDASDTTALLYRIVHEPVPVLPESATAGLPIDVRPVIMAALSKDPADRPQSARDMKAMLHGKMAVPELGADSTPRDLPAKNPAKPESKKTPAWLLYAAIGIVGMLILAVVLVGSLSGGSGGTPVNSTNDEQVVAADEDDTSHQSSTTESQPESKPEAEPEPAAEPEPEAEPEPIQNPREVAQQVAGSLVEGERSKEYSMYLFADVSGDGAEELLLSIKSEQGSGYTFYIYSVAEGQRKLYAGGFGYPDERYEFYKDTSSFLAYGGGHGAEWVYSATLTGDEYAPYAQKVRNPSSKYGGGNTDGPWAYSLEGSGTCGEGEYEQAVSQIAQGPLISVEGPGLGAWEFIYES